MLESQLGLILLAKDVCFSRISISWSELPEMFHCSLLLKLQSILNSMFTTGVLEES